MLSHGSTIKLNHSPGVLATLAILAGAGNASAGTLAQLALPSHAVKSPPRMELCAGGARTSNCRAALDTALHAAQLFALKSAPHALRGFYVSDVTEARAPLPVKFNTDPEWKKRAILIAHEGLTFLRMPQSGGREFTVGINRHGILGFSLKDSAAD